MVQETISPPLYIQEQRSLDSQRLIVRGPTGWNARWVWTLPKDQQVAVHPTRHPAKSFIASIDHPNLSVLSSEEMFGFDATTSSYPRLRRTQQYSTVVLRSEIDRNLAGAIVSPADPLLKVSSGRVTVSLCLPATTDALFLSELAADTEPDHLVWRYEGETAGYLILDISLLLKQLPLTMDVWLIHRADEVPCQQLQLYGVLPTS